MSSLYDRSTAIRGTRCARAATPGRRPAPPPSTRGTGPKMRLSAEFPRLSPITHSRLRRDDDGGEVAGGRARRQVGLDQLPAVDQHLAVVALHPLAGEGRRPA